LKPKARKRGFSNKRNGTQPSRSKTRADVTNVNYTGPREVKSRLDRLKCSNALDLVAFMHDPGQGHTGMKIEFGTPDSPNPQFIAVELTPYHKQAHNKRGRQPA
jgi:hypothetical protein